MYMETSSNDPGYGVFVRFERTGDIQINIISFIISVISSNALLRSICNLQEKIFIQ